MVTTRKRRGTGAERAKSALRHPRRKCAIEFSHPYLRTKVILSDDRQTPSNGDYLSKYANAIYAIARSSGIIGPKSSLHRSALHRKNRHVP
jgi:hypothetical protein